MKTGRIFRFSARCGVLLAGIIVDTSLLQAQQARDVIREEALRQQVAAAPTLKAELKAKAVPLSSPAPAIQSSLWKSSIILSDGEKFTLVPVGSILHLPAGLRSRVLAKPQGDFTFWPSFLRRNAAWLSAREVSLPLSRGNAQESKALLKSLDRDPRLIVATFKGGPITILEPAPARPNPKPKTP